MKIKYVIEVKGSQPSYHMTGSGDPSRTLILENAKRYDYVSSAENAMRRLECKYPDRKYKVRTVSIEVKVLD